MSRLVMFLFLLALTAGAVLSSSCSGGAEPAAAAPTTAPAAVTLARENVTEARTGRITAGPTVSGQFTPAREATVRTQVGGSIVSLTVDRGQPVEAGQVVARISSRDLQEALMSAQAAVTSAESALAVARTEAQRTESLVKGGALAARDLDQAQNAVSGAEAQLAAARARERAVSLQLEDTTVRAPFAGVVSARPASVGDVVTPGTEVLTIIDPSSLRLEALVPADQATQIRPGAPVHLSVRGFKDPLTGRVDRLNATADAVTRQVAIFVSVPNPGGRLIAGMFAEGRVETSARNGLIVPLSAVDETGAVPFVTRIRGDRAERVDVALGVRQPETEEVEITGGLTAGDTVVVGSAKGIAAGTPVRIAG